MEFTEGKYIRWRHGDASTPVLLTAVHDDEYRIKESAGDWHTGDIAQDVSYKTGASCIIAKVKRNVVDLNRYPKCIESHHAHKEFRHVIQKDIELKGLMKNSGLKTNFLKISVHGCKNIYGMDIELGTRNFELASEIVADYVYGKLSSSNPTFRIMLDNKFIGDPSLSFYRKLYGSMFHTIQLELSHQVRTEYFNEIVNSLSEIVKDFPMAHWDDHGDD